MSNPKIHLTDYDMVVALTQSAINEAMTLYVDNLKKDIVLLYKDDQGTPEPVENESEADYIFKGTLKYRKNPTEIIQFHVPGENQKVYYNLSFQDAEFISKIEPAFSLKQEAKDAPWIITFMVSLALQDSVFEDLPEDIQEKVREYEKQYESDMFSVQQLCVDLNSAVFNSFENISGLGEAAADLLGTLLKAHLEEQQKKGEILFGYGIKSDGKSENSRPDPKQTLIPTDLNFCVSPYKGEKGESKAELDTLNYLIMMDNNPPPDFPPEKFDFNWVEDNQTPGIMVMKRELILQEFIHRIVMVTRILDPKIKVKHDQFGITDFSQGSVGELELQKDPKYDILATHSYQTTADDSYTTPDLQVWNCYREEVNNKFTTACNLKLKDSRILSFTGRCHSIHNYVKKTYLCATWGLLLSTQDDIYEGIINWQIDLEIHMDLEVNGKLNFVVTDSDLDIDPGEFSPEEEELRNQIQSGVLKKALRTIKTLTERAIFVPITLPGADSFTFNQPTFSSSQDLTICLNYLSP